jgi:hypothetical protein
LPILFDEERCVWALQGSVSTYGLGVDVEGRLRHLYHGAALMRRGTKVSLDGELSSTMVEITAG